MTSAAASPADLPIAISIGDVAGIGPEILFKTLQRDPAWVPRCRLFGPRDWLRSQAQRYGVVPQIEDLPLQGQPALGRIDAVAGEWAFQSIVAATTAVLQGRARALVTAPIHKEAMQRAGHVYPGHTELLAELAGGVPVRMMLANPELRTVLVTIHMALRAAIEALNTEGIVQTLRITDASLRRFGIGRDRPQGRPCIAVAGLNPHAGEGGLFGREEIEMITPAIEQARAQGIDAHGPFAPDTIFMRARGLRAFDAVIALYHDQGLIPVKYLGVEQGVNVTLGLPFVRTSPDHGTAFDIAGKDIADPSSFAAALQMADALSRH